MKRHRKNLSRLLAAMLCLLDGCGSQPTAQITEPEPAPKPAPEPEKEPSSGWVDCPSCFSGNCTACNGRKGKYSYSPGLPREWEPCWKCHGDGDCSKCNGFGKILG